MFKSHDIALLIQYGKLYASNRKGEIVSEALPMDAFHAASNRDELLALLKKTYKSLLPRVALIPPRVVAVSPLSFESDRILLKELLIHAGARGVLLLDRAMAAAVGHFEGNLEKAKALFVLLDPSAIEVAVIDKYACPFNWHCRAETVRENTTSGNPAKLVSYIRHLAFSQGAMDELGEVLKRLARDDYSPKGIHLWSPSVATPAVMDALTSSNLDINLIAPDCLLRGCQRVVHDLKLFMRDK